MHMDTVSNAALDIVPHLLTLEPADDRQKEALSYLDGWDGDLAPDSVAAAIYQVWCKHLAEAILLPKMGRQLYDHYYAKRQWTITFQYQVPDQRRCVGSVDSGMFQKPLIAVSALRCSSKATSAFARSACMSAVRSTRSS
jgi:penicillin amidase